ncbi:WD40 repeat-like protein [Neocallimastix californiae]|uniref:WD40 repeat-like protein n=1 Tax=Neocallimastix californiae TaxID=1754190 RepID=A0A1Y1ZKW7_9FUNG|nr:WD40 repeat-like protein [Neocallimastix californiae]|eukprot:ORY10908.1 WD40 repeat-like protein [Neocallimastix californiae]
MKYSEQIEPEKLNNLSTSLSKLTDFEKASIRRKSKNLQLELPKVNQLSSPQKNESVKRTIEEDVDYVLIQIDHSMDYTLMCISNLLVVLSFASILNKTDILHKYIIQANEIAKDFIANTLKNLWDILHLEIPMQRLSLVGLRDMTKLSEHLKELIHNHNANNAEKTRTQSTFKVQKIHHKFQLFHYICTCLDIQILPPFMDAHSGGVKSIEASSFDKNLWLTAGYDGTIKIYNMKKKKLLSQYAGHRSIVTSAHFTREDSNIVSCSFDQTIKIWNAKTAKCEKTLIGHTDSIITCAVTPNSRYIISGGVDCSIRIWELATGNNILTINKHNRWVKIIKVSLDGKYIVSGGLDKKIYVWDIKFLVNSKNPVPSFHRCIDYHTDYILDIDLGPNDIMISSSSDMTVKIQNYVTGTLIHDISLTPIWATAIRFTEDGSMFGLGCSDNSLLIYSTATGKFLRQIRLFNFGIISIAFDRELEYALIGTSEGIIQKVTL